MALRRSITEAARSEGRRKIKINKDIINKSKSIGEREASQAKKMAGSEFKSKPKFAEQHVRWTGYLTIANNHQLRQLLDQGQIPSLTRFINQAVEEQLQRMFGINGKIENG